MNPNRLLFICLLFISVWVSPEPARACQVGYVNAVLTNGYNFIANPLDDGNNNSLTNLIPSPPNGSRAYVWDVTNQVFLPRATHLASRWNLNYDLPVGKGFVLWVPQQYTNTFVGSLPCGTVTNFVAGTNKFSLLGSKVPLPGPITSALGFPGTDGDDVYFFRSASQSFSDAYTYHGGYGWFDPNNPLDLTGTNGPFCNVAESFFVQNPGPNTNWVQIFPPPPAAAPSSLSVAANSIERNLSQIKISGGKVTLKLQDPGGGSFDVQFSTDGLSWTTVARNQSGDTWTGKLPDAKTGYFQAVTSQSGRSAP